MRPTFVSERKKTAKYVSKGKTLAERVYIRPTSVSEPTKQRNVCLNAILAERVYIKPKSVQERNRTCIHKISSTYIHYTKISVRTHENTTKYVSEGRILAERAYIQ